MDQESSSFGLVRRAKAGDAGALDRLILRYLPRLRRWARRRLPAWARDVAETEDLVQETLFNAIRQLPTFEMREPYSWRAYMKRSVQNRVHDEVKRARRHPPGDALPENLLALTPSPADRAIAREDFWRCRTALARLRPADRQLILAVLTDDLSFQTLAQRTGKRSADAARMALGRALNRLAADMERLEL
jgi:RNA polymerase sigma factor (sigma-70 family)